MPLSLLNHSALALFAQRTRIPTSARSIGFCAIWVCISSSSSSTFLYDGEVLCLREEASISVVSLACSVSAFIIHLIITLVQSLFFKGSMSWILIATTTIGFFVGLATLLGGCL